MTVSSVGLGLLALAIAGGPIVGQGTAYQGPGMTHTEVAPGVHAFVFDNALGGAANVDGSSVAIINETDVVVVDAQWTPASTRRVLAEIRKLTPKPVRYVITTHWHGDHWYGNQVYRDAFPGVEFVAHEHTRADLERLELPDIAPTRDSTVPAMIRDLGERLRRGVRRDGSPMTATDSAAIVHQRAALQWAIPALREIVPVRPTLTITDSLVLHRGERTIVVRYLGRGNTRGDLSVWLPKERVLATGDLLVHPAPYSFGSYLGEWRAVLAQLRSLPAAVIIPGHGEIQRDWAYLDLFTELLDYTLERARAEVAKGSDLEATRKAIDLGVFRARFSQGDPARERAFNAYYATPAVERAWLEARGELDK